jgi:DNA-binding CsgD family transcriptional regulator
MRGAGEAAALGLGWELAGIGDRDEFLRGTAEMLMHLLAADDIGWNAIERGGGIELAHVPDPDQDLTELVAALAAVADDHPLIRSYLADPSRTDDAPRRLSDVASRRELLANRAYVEFLLPRGAEHQLTVLTGRPRPGSIRGWVLERRGRDFTDRDVEMATALQRMLAALDRAFPDREPAPADPGAVERLGLTGREVEVLRHVAAGLTADAVARVLRISPRTVRKHLENSYRKLDCHDRLVAVDRARALGIVPPAAPGLSGPSSPG